MLAPARELSAGYLVRTVEDHLVNVPCVYEDLVHTNPEEFHIPADKARPASPAVIPDVRIRRKTSLSDRRAEKPAADESVAMLHGLLCEDEHASCLASIEPFDAEKSRKFVLASRWIRDSSGRLGARFSDGAGSARVLGFFCHGGIAGLTKDCLSFPGFTKLLNRLVQHVMPGHVCTTLAILSQTTARPHKDKFNQPTSNAVIPLEVPSNGGGIWVQDESGTDRRWVTPKQQASGTVHHLTPLCPFLLNPHKWHATEDWSEGSRILLVAYSLKGLERATQQQLQWLRDVGFQLTAGDCQQGGDLEQRIEENGFKAPEKVHQGPDETASECHDARAPRVRDLQKEEMRSGLTLVQRRRLTNQLKAGDIVDVPVMYARYGDEAGSFSSLVRNQNAPVPYPWLDPANAEKFAAAGAVASRRRDEAPRETQGCDEGRSDAQRREEGRGETPCRDEGRGETPCRDEGRGETPCRDEGRGDSPCFDGRRSDSSCDRDDTGEAVVESQGILKGVGGLRQKRVHWAPGLVEGPVVSRDTSVFSGRSFRCKACESDVAGLCSICERHVVEYAESDLKASPSLGQPGSAGWEDENCGPLGVGVSVGHEGGLKALNADFSEDCPLVNESVTSNLLFCEPTCVEWESFVGRASDREVGPDDHDSSGEIWVGVGEASESFDPDAQQFALKALLSRECKLQDRSGVAGDCDREGYIRGLSSTIKRLEERCCKADEGLEYSTLPDAEVLTTHTVPLEEVERHYSLWSSAVQAELDSLVHEKQAVRVITSAEMQAMQDKGTCVTIIPSKMVFTRKAGGRHKARLVACGNHLDGQNQAKGKQSQSKANLYAGGIDPSVMRQAASIAVKKGWSGGATDITTAFLNAELLDRLNPRSSPPPLSLDVPTEVIVLKIPSIVHRHGHVDRSCFMLVCKALYGLDQSPRDWSIKRDTEIESMSCHIDGATCMFEQSLVDSNLWYLRRVPKDGESHCWREPVACMLVYVDDLLAFGPSSVLTLIFEQITSRWKCGPVEWIPEDPAKPPLKFFGFELRWDGRDLLLGQQDFIRDVATRYPEATPSCIPATPGTLDVEDSSERRPEDISACQTALGEVLWVAGRTRPDIIFAVSRLAQTMSRDPATVRKRVMQLIGYLVYTQDLCLRYRATYSCQGEPGATATPNAEGVIEAMTDSAFAPVCERSQESTLVYTQGSLTGWNTGRQPFTAASTAESELLSLMTGFSFGRAQTYVLQEFMGKVPRLIVLNDNMASISIVNGDSNGWRSRHLRIRAHVLREQAKQGHIIVGHIEGAKNIADAGAKALPYPRLKLLRDGMGLDTNKNARDARPAGATKVVDPISAAKIQAVVLTLAAVTAEAQQLVDESEDHGHELWFLMFLLCCTSIALWEGVKWACRWCCRRRRIQMRDVERHEPEEERSSDGENQPDDEDELQELSPLAADSVEDHGVAREFTVSREGIIVRYVDDVMYVGPPPEEEERLRRRRQGQRVYRDEPDFEPAAVEASGLPPWNAQNRVRQTLEAQRGATGSNEGPNWMPNQFVNYPVIRLRADWPASENQPPLAHLAAHQSAWGGLASALHQLRPNDAYTRDEYTRHDARQNVLIRWHFAWRVMLFDPNRTTSPIAISSLTGRRRTVITYRDGTEELLDDNFRVDSARRTMDQQWVGRTELEIRVGT